MTILSWWYTRSNNWLSSANNIYACCPLLIRIVFRYFWSIWIQIWWQTNYSLIPIVMNRSLRCLPHNTTWVMPWHVQNVTANEEVEIQNRIFNRIVMEKALAKLVPVSSIQVNLNCCSDLLPDDTKSNLIYCHRDSQEWKMKRIWNDFISGFPANILVTPFFGELFGQWIRVIEDRCRFYCKIPWTCFRKLATCVWGTITKVDVRAWHRPSAYTCWNETQTRFTIH